MSNYTLNNIKRFQFHIHKEDYWDMYLNHDDLGSYSFCGMELNEDCLSSYIDARIPKCVDGNELLGSDDYNWKCATNTGLTLENIGFTGIDNGLINYRKDRITNKEFYDIFTNSTYSIDSGDTRLHLHMVSGNTYLYEYPVTVNDDYIKLNGGFYQGFFRTDDNYYILPASIESEWDLEFKIRLQDYKPESDKTLNDIHPDNKGIFFYIGTRAENKWIELYDKESQPLAINSIFDKGIQFGEDCLPISGNPFDISSASTSGASSAVTSGNAITVTYDDCLYSFDTHEGISNYRTNPSGTTIIELDDDIFDVDFNDDSVNEDGEACYIEGEEPSNNFVEDELDLETIDFQTKKGFNIKVANEEIIESDNKFLLFDRTREGLTTYDYQGDEVLYLQYKKNGYKGNLFLYMNRTPSGHTVYDVDSIEGFDSNVYDDFYKDIYGNALAFIINPDGSIGYRYMTRDCSGDTEGHYTVLHGESFPNMVQLDEWYKINVKIKASENTMKLYFYINDKLKYITSELPKLNLHELAEINEKQEGVPYNISIGGGTQGLAERILPDYMHNPTKVYPIEQHFAGSFIGDFQYFKFYSC